MNKVNLFVIKCTKIGMLFKYNYKIKKKKIENFSLTFNLTASPLNNLLSSKWSGKPLKISNEYIVNYNTLCYNEKLRNYVTKTTLY